MMGTVGGDTGAARDGTASGRVGRVLRPAWDARQWAKGHAVGHGDRTRRWLVPVVVVVVAAIVGSGFVILFVDTGTAAGASISLESAQSAGIDPFTRTVAIGEVADFPTHLAPITRTVTASLSTDTTTGGLTATGNAPGLYGGTGNNGVCDPHQLADYLTRTPAKAAAWAATLGITTKQIPTYVATLTPVVLTTDTRVTNHGYANGAATPRQSILQAGTAVLVDHYGIPRVKCGCGNPLTEPTSQPIPTTTGTPWTGYTPDQVTTITPAPRPQPDLTLTNITTGRTYTQPTGTRGTDQTGGSSATLDDAALLSHAYPTACLVEDRITLTQGSWTQPNVDPTIAERAAAYVTHLDATGDGKADGIVVVTYFSGGSLACVRRFVFTSRSGQIVEVGEIPSDGSPTGVKPTLDGGANGRIVIWEPSFGDADPRCCPSHYVRKVFVDRDGTFVEAGDTTYTPDQFNAMSANDKEPQP